MDDSLLGNVIMPLPEILGAAVISALMWYYRLRDWLMALAVTLSEIMDIIDCYRGVCRHG